jgi:hypothetical protein
MQQVSKVFPHRRGAPPSKDMKIRGDFLPSGCSRIRYRAEIKPLDQNSVGPSQTSDHDLQPVCHKPGGYPAVRINVLYRSEKAFPASLPVEKPIKQRSDHGRYRVQHIRDQLVRKQGKGHILFATQKPGDRNPFFPENRENVDDIAFIRGNRSVAIVLAANRAYRSDGQREINFTLDKRFFIFLDTLECGNKRQLYRFTALSSGRQVFGSYTYGPASLRRVVSFSRSFSYLDNLPSFISSVTILCKNSC